MSGKPSPEGVTKAIELLKLIDESNGTVTAADRVLAQATKDRDEAATLHASASMELWALMTSMDLTDLGNYGHTGRMTWFLTELVAQMGAK